MDKEQIESEFYKCKSDPVYFFNTYTAQGKEKPITKEDWEDGLAFFRLRHNGHFKRKRPTNTEDDSH
jgi:hypothetical protein